MCSFAAPTTPQPNLEVRKEEKKPREAGQEFSYHGFAFLVQKEINI